MELTGEWTIPVGGKWPLNFTWKGDDLPTGVTIVSATKTVSPATGLTVGDPVVTSGADGVNFWAEAATAGNYSILIVATRSDGAKNIALGNVTVVAASDLTLAAANAIITVEQLAAFMGEAAAKNLADMVINSVSNEFELFCGRILKQVTYATTTKLYFDGEGSKYLMLPSWPAASVTGVYEDDVLLVEGDDADYLVYTSDDDAYLYKVSGVWAKGRKNIYITSVALGYAAIPSDIQLAALKQSAVEYMKAKQKTWNDTSRSQGDGSVSLLQPGLLPDVEAVLKRYRRFGL